MYISKNAPMYTSQYASKSTTEYVLKFNPCQGFFLNSVYGNLEYL